MKVYLNPGHDVEYDSGACNPDKNLREADVALRIGERVKKYLESAGCEVRMLQSDNLCGWDCRRSDRPVAVTEDANEWNADVFVSIHCNAYNTEASGCEVECYGAGLGETLATCIYDQIVDNIPLKRRGVRHMPALMVLKYTDMPACLVETAFIDNDGDADLLIEREDEFARAIARGVTDYQCEVE
ncbi:putative N-acetylmuramoyl-L-alanine amidase [Selenomonas ruminantium subsp. lactilytica TAM6421]|uniref:Putative N-acetylmuramoyl-L-alanine amidase n=1 Tax=Selenomonas ruminantium subsp. lactilytica (strain NBRC 103574 / TAM6421) TaxID=927704 RepID=I0GRX8_SELRL|nr:N-acetylmuramoyl-L-alanine amidase [Selenomonas ruminantium]BAL83515.1 putative N-acetylmuramoyl-L-alanine amidase [Selenomonas ruminantium subsp. lactilytica TAM6421]